MNQHYSDFGQLVLDRAAHRPHNIAYRFHKPQASQTVNLSMGVLDQRIRAIAFGLQRRNLIGERVVLALPHSSEFILAFFGCLVAGAIAVPLPRQRVGKDYTRFNAVLENAQPRLVLADAAALDRIRENVPAKIEVATPDAIADDPAEYRKPRPNEDSLAVLLYTSGSTGDPKGVMITHANMFSNCRLIEETLRLDAQSSGVLWLPFHHDMGLVGAVLQPMYSNVCVDLMTPQDFLRAPMSWLEALSRIEATTTAAPNFALELCCEAATPEAVAGLNLSSLRCLLTGSEPVNPNTLKRFAETFAPCGFQFDAFLPAYGLAEATSLATGTLRHGSGPPVHALDARALAAGVVQPPVDDAPVGRFVGNGAPNGLIRIASTESGHPLGEGEIGEIWLTGPGIAKGYWGRPDLTEAAFGARFEGEPAAGPFYRTGDLGFVLKDELFVAGRLKDLIIVRERNIYPQDIEDAATRGQDLLCTGAAAFAANGEEVVLVTEASMTGLNALGDQQTAADLVADILRRVWQSREITPAEICIIRPGRLPRTSSGKIRREAVRKEWEETGFSAVLLHRWTRPAETGDAAAPDRSAEGPLTRHDAQNWLIERISHHCGQPKHLIDLDAPFTRYGLDSVTAIEMIEAINRLKIGGRAVDPIDPCDHPTIARLLDHMFTEGDAGRGDTVEETRPRPSWQAEPSFKALLDN